MKKFREFLVEDKAQEGEGGVLYHASSAKKLSSFKPMSHFGTAQASRQRAAHNELNDNPVGSVHAVRIKHGKSFKIDELGEHHPHEVLNHLHEKGMFSKEEHAHHTEAMDKLSSGEANQHLANAIRSKGYHSLHYKNEVEDKGSTSHIITHPNQVRVVRSRENKQGESYGWLHRINMKTYSRH